VQLDAGFEAVIVGLAVELAEAEEAVAAEGEDAEGEGGVD
jgi:hypothetical protein